MIRLKLLIAYNGGPFRGWQSQATGDAVQDLVEQAFTKLCGERIVVHGAGRTDAGVHALGQVAHAELRENQLPLRKWALALNGHLPREIRVMKVTRAAPDFHARFSARGKVYIYRIWNAPVLHPFERGRAWHLCGLLDLDELRASLALLEGTHDFAGFAGHLGKDDRDTVRTINRISFRRAGALLTLRFEGTGFLYHTVRLLTGTAVRCAQGRAERSWISELLAAKGALKTSFAAPAEGLYLSRVLY